MHYLGPDRTNYGRIETITEQTLTTTPDAHIDGGETTTTSSYSTEEAVSGSSTTHTPVETLEGIARLLLTIVLCLEICNAYQHTMRSL